MPRSNKRVPEDKDFTRYVSVAAYGTKLPSKDAGSIVRVAFTTQREIDGDLRLFYANNAAFGSYSMWARKRQTK